MGVNRATNQRSMDDARPPWSKGALVRVAADGPQRMTNERELKKGKTHRDAKKDPPSQFKFCTNSYCG